MKIYRWVLGIAFLAGCGGPSTHMLSSWKDPGAKPVRFEKIAVIAATENAARRREAEDGLVALIPRAVSTYSFIPAQTLKTPEAVRQSLQKAGCDGVVVMRLVSLKEETVYVPASSFNEFVGEPYDWEHMGIPVQQKAAVIETRLYSTAQGLLWAGRSKTVEPGTLQKTLPGIVGANAQQLEKDGLLPSN